MKNKNSCLVLGILGTLLFIGYLNESEHSMFGYSINIWVVRIAWLIIAVTNFVNYFKIRKNEKESNKI